MAVGRLDLRLHDMRHTELTLAAATGATTAELMHRAGHASAPATLRYQRASRDRGRFDALRSSWHQIFLPRHVREVWEESISSIC